MNKYATGTHPEGVRAVCVEHERVVLKDTREEAEEVIEEHKERMDHDGPEPGICAWDILDDPVYMDIPDYQQTKDVFILAARKNQYGMMDPGADHQAMTEDDSEGVESGSPV